MSEGGTRGRRTRLLGPEVSPNGKCIKSQSLNSSPKVNDQLSQGGDTDRDMKKNESSPRGASEIIWKSQGPQFVVEQGNGESEPWVTAAKRGRKNSLICLTRGKDTSHGYRQPIKQHTITKSQVHRSFSEGRKKREMSTKGGNSIGLKKPVRRRRQRAGHTKGTSDRSIWGKNDKRV